jgi:hypothetical protein
MREFIIKYTFGRYYWKFPFQKHYNYLDRGPFWYFNGFLLIGIIWLIFGRPELWLNIVPFVWVLPVLYLGFPLGGFGYYDQRPVTWDELDIEQKYVYGLGAMSGHLTKKLYFPPAYHTEWLEIKKYMKNKYNLI